MFCDGNVQPYSSELLQAMRSAIHKIHSGRILLLLVKLALETVVQMLRAKVAAISLCPVMDTEIKRLQTAQTNQFCVDKYS